MIFFDQALPSDDTCPVLSFRGLLFRKGFILGLTGPDLGYELLRRQLDAKGKWKFDWHIRAASWKR